jgi:hypothetical protein
MGKSKAYQREIKGEDKLSLQHPEELLYSDATEDDADIPMEIIHLAIQILPKHLHDPSTKYNFNMEKIPEGYQHSLRPCGPISYKESNTEDEADEHNEEEMRAEEQEDTLDLWWSKRSTGRTGGLKDGPSGIIPHNMDLF